MPFLGVVYVGEESLNAHSSHLKGQRRKPNVE